MVNQRLIILLEMCLLLRYVKCNLIPLYNFPRLAFLFFSKVIFIHKYQFYSVFGMHERELRAEKENTFDLFHLAMHTIAHYYRSDEKRKRLSIKLLCPSQIQMGVE